MRKPNFLIIGAAKCGTTSLVNYLNQHPKIYIPLHEIHYFSRFPHSGFDNYKKQLFTDKEVVGEKSTSYLYYTACHSLIKSCLPDIKLIAITRDPVERAYSNWHMRFTDKRLIIDGIRFNKNNGNILKQLDFNYLIDFYLDNRDNEDLIFQKPLDVIHRSAYTPQLHSIFQHFNSGQVLILSFEDMIGNLQNTLNTLTTFLGVEPSPINTRKIHRSGKYTKVGWDKHKEKLRQFFYQQSQSSILAAQQ
jgi:hypothetical protein